MPKNGLVHITTATFTTQASVSIDNCFSATYTHYLVKRNLLGSGAGNRIDMRLRVSGSDASGANYRYQTLEGDAGSTPAARYTGLTAIPLLGFTEATSFGYSESWISNPFEAVRTTVWCDFPNAQTGNIYFVSMVGAHDLTTSYTGMTVFPVAGTITGSVSVWGLVKS